MNTNIPHEVFALIIILVAAALLLAGKLTGAEWVDIVQWLGVAVIGGKSAQAVVTARAPTPPPTATPS